MPLSDCLDGASPIRVGPHYWGKLILSLAALLAVFHFQGLAQSNNSPVIVEAREYSGMDPAMWQGLYAARDGKVYTGLCTEPGEAHFYLYDPAADSNRVIADLAEFLNEKGKGIRTTSKIHNHPVEDSQGNIYFVPMNNGAGPKNIDYTSWQGGHWIKYDPKTDKLEDLGLVDQGVGCYPLAIDTKRNYLFGIGYTSYLYRFDIEKRITRNLGRVSDWDICRDIACDDDGNVYGCFPISRIWKYEAADEKVYDLTIQVPFDPAIYPTELRNPQIDRAAIWRAVEWDSQDQAVYGITCGSGSILFKYEPRVGPQGKVTALARMCDSKFLQPEDRKDIPYSPLAFAIDRTNRKIYFVPSARGYDINEYEETFGSAEDHHLLVYDLKTNERADLGILRVSDGRRVYGSEAATCAPDGTLYICAQAETKTPEFATGRIAGKPVALHLLIYKPR